MAQRRFVLAGNPNSGKTTLFNALTGSTARTGNYAGITVERRSGTLELPTGERVELVDLPGTYSLTARSPEEQVAVDAILPRQHRYADAAIVVCDANALERQLYLAIQVLESGLPVIIVLNMMDEVRASGIRIDVDALSAELRVPVVAVVARKGEGLDALRSACVDLPESRPPLSIPFSEAAERDVSLVESALQGTLHARRPLAMWAILSLGDDELQVSPELRRAVANANESAAAGGRELDREIITARYDYLDRIISRCIQYAPQSIRMTDRIDAVLTHPLWGLLAFLGVMAILFQALFAWSDPLIGVIEEGVGCLVTAIRALTPEGLLSDLLVDGIVAGVGNVVVFVPQIALLSLFIAVLEDSGYLARVAFVIDRVMRSVGLHGRAFVPLLSGFACAVPAVLATRTIENRRDRLVTMLALPLMSCSARLPVYTLLVAVAFPANATVFAGISVGALTLFCMYILSVVATLGAAAVLRRTVVRGVIPPLVLELPPYRFPTVRNLWLSVWQRTTTFLLDAGTVILAITIVLWGLLTFPRDPQLEARFEASRQAARTALDGDELDARIEQLDLQHAQERMEQSAAGTIGRWIEPVIEPLGFDWRIGVGLLGSFAAREVLVSTLGIVYGVGEDSLRERLQEARRPDGDRVFTPLVSVSLMIFFVLAAQCMSTLAVVKRESGGWGWPLFMLFYMNTLAYVASLLVYQVGRLLGWG